MLSPLLLCGQSLSLSVRDKKYEEQLSDLQYQLLYGDTSKDIQLARMADELLHAQQMLDEERRQHASVRKQLANMADKKIEQWILNDALQVM